LGSGQGDFAGSVSGSGSSYQTHALADDLAHAGVEQAVMFAHPASFAMVL
jgi:hypothetical protein